MNMSIEKSGSVVVVEVAETTIGAGVAEEFRDRIRSELPDEDGQLVVGLTDVDALDTAALGALVSLLLAVRPAGRVVLYGVGEGVAQSLRASLLDVVFACEETKEAALAHFSAASA